MSEEHPEAGLRGRMIREVWDASPFFRYADAVLAVDVLLAMPEVRDLLDKSKRKGAA